MTADLQRCYDEQTRCATLLLAGPPEQPSIGSPDWATEQHGLKMGLADWCMEEVFILLEQREVAARIQQLREMVPPERREFVDEMHRELNPGWEPEGGKL